MTKHYFVMPDDISIAECDLQEELSTDYKGHYDAWTCLQEWIEHIESESLDPLDEDAYIGLADDETFKPSPEWIGKYLVKPG